jgi:hypothetical protein
LKLENYLWKHWFDTIGWTMAETMHNIVLQAIKECVQKVEFISLSCDEVTTQYN